MHVMHPYIRIYVVVTANFKEDRGTTLLFR